MERKEIKQKAVFLRRFRNAIRVLAGNLTFSPKTSANGQIKMSKIFIYSYICASQIDEKEVARISILGKNV